jgi:hypothetical protein
MRTPTDEHLADQIVRLSLNGRINTPFRVGDYREHFPEVSEHHIRTVLANYELKGYMVRSRGMRPRFRRISKGLYEPT